MRLIGKYLRANKLMGLVALYACVALILKLAGGADICPPCLYSLVTGRQCPGCGLTRALLACLQGDLSGAWGHNPLIFVVVPALAFYAASDMRRFYGEYGRSQASEGAIKKPAL